MWPQRASKANFSLIYSRSITPFRSWAQKTLAAPLRKFYCKTGKAIASSKSPDRTAACVEMVDGFNSGWIDFGVPGTQRFTGATELQTVIDQLVERA
jgi:hypothetical protein